MLEAFKSHIQTNFKHLVDTHFLLACSGGLDSVVMAHLCYKTGMSFSLAHCNFNLRGAESDEDEEFTKCLANKFGVKIYVTHFNTMNYVDTNKVSIEMAARTLRYSWFEEIMVENQIKTLVTAHHADDNLETFLINLSRGTGIDGLNGITVKSDKISRPLLAFSRAEILSFAQNESIAWRDDSTNEEEVHLRNKIRHKIVPRLKELHPTFLANFKKTQQHLEDTTMIVEDHLSELKHRLFENQGELTRISITKLAKLRPLKAYLHGLLNTYGFRAWDDIVALIDGMSGKEVRSNTHRLVKDREYLLLEALATPSLTSYEIVAPVDKIEEPLALSFENVDLITDTAKNILYVDKVALNYPLRVRKWKKGDYFYPFGMKGKKKLSKYFKDEKIDVISKEKQWLLCAGGEIIWIIGKRADDRFKVTDQTKQIIKITWHN